MAGATEMTGKETTVKTARNETAENIVKIWTDGACSGNPGPGGWGAVLR